MSIGDTHDDFSDLVNNFGMPLDSILSIHQQIVCTATYSELLRISSFRQYPAVDATKRLTSAFTLSRLDYSLAVKAIETDHVFSI